MRRGACTVKGLWTGWLTPQRRRPRRGRSVTKLGVLTLSVTLLLAATSMAANDRILYLNNQALWSADSAGENRHFLTEGPGSTKNSVTLEDLSPNGQVGVYAAAGTPGIYLVNLTTGEQRSIYGEGGSPMFSPDGKKVLFSYNAGSTEEDIATINIDGTGFTKLVAWKGKQYYPDFSPDGTKISFTTNTESKGKGFGGEGPQVFVANANGSSAVRVTHNTTGITQGSISGYFSPSGTLLAFVGLKSGGARIYTVSTTGTNQTQITTDTGPTVRHGLPMERKLRLLPIAPSRRTDRTSTP
jgi:Tol biopolymer transport system component